ncbi:hypothetical protein [Longispora albida]|uniref:hypothetical protein n=1 Tax=Longispora albida TaxID=203523 RepID=UPI00036F11E5|nr:hypothetical protein [Longispora albida]
MFRKVVTLALAAGLALTVPAPASAAAVCGTDPAVAGTAEQSRLGSTSTELIRRGGLSAWPDRFPAALCTARTQAEAESLAVSWGTALWQSAVSRAQGSRTGDLAPGDDRPLYWTRLRLSLQIRQWTPVFTADKTSVTRAWEDASRGLLGNTFSSGTGVKKIFVSGFDPFGLDGDQRTANPSGAAALALNGRRITLASGAPAEIRSVVLPVRYADFDAGIVERAFGPRLATADAITTISQGYPGLFTIEGWAGRARSADPYPDNDRALSGGTQSHPVDAPGLGAGPEFIATTLPAPSMIAAGTGSFPAELNPEVIEIPAGQTAPVYRPDGPTPGSRAVAGGGGGYLSNEVAYRTNRLRLERGLPAMPGGHLHTPVLYGLPAGGALTSPQFEANEAAITGQITRLLTGL